MAVVDHAVPLPLEPPTPESYHHKNHLRPKTYADAAHEALVRDDEWNSSNHDGAEEAYDSGASYQVNGLGKANSNHVVYETLTEPNGSYLKTVEPSDKHEKGSGEDEKQGEDVKQGEEEKQGEEKKQGKEVKQGEHEKQGEEVKQGGEGKQGEERQGERDKQGENEKHIQEHRVITKERSTKEPLLSGRKAGQGWRRSGIRWAPYNVPLQRRLQTLVVLWHTLSIPILVTTFFFLCSIPILWPIIVPYLLYISFSRAGANGSLYYRSEWLRRSPIWSLFASFFPARLHRSEPLPATRKYIFGYHPHGIISHGALAAFLTEALGFSQLFPGITNTLLTLESNFRIPLYREYILRMGLASVSRESCENLLTKGGQNGEGMGRAITIVVGGARESLDARPYTLRLVLKRRKGFVKLAIRTGADLVPVLAFGENDVYEQVSPEDHPSVQKFQIMFKKVFGWTVPLFHARGVFNYDVGLLPYRRPLNVVVGRPIKVERQLKPVDGYVDEIHSLYVQELERLWETWKDEFAKDRTGELEIIE